MLKEISMLNLKVIKERNIAYNTNPNENLDHPDKIFDIAINALRVHEQDVESFYIFTLDTKNKITGIFEVSRGCLNGTIVHPREVFKRAILHNANSLICMHNHPSGDSTPSRQDLEITTQLVEAGKLLDIKVLDHIIIADEFNYSSLATNKLM